jgi:hypothetical protein
MLEVEPTRRFDPIHPIGAYLLVRSNLCVCLVLIYLDGRLLAICAFHPCSYLIKVQEFKMLYSFASIDVFHWEGFYGCFDGPLIFFSRARCSHFGPLNSFAKCSSRELNSSLKRYLTIADSHTWYWNVISFFSIQRNTSGLCYMQLLAPISSQSPKFGI